MKGIRMVVGSTRELWGRLFSLRTRSSADPTGPKADCGQNCPPHIGGLSTALIALALASALSAQQFPMQIDRLAAQASNKVDLSLSGPLLQFAAKFLDDKDPDEGKVRKLIVGLDGIYVKCYSFKTPNTWTDADLETIRRHLRAPEWSRIINFSGDDGSGEIYVRSVDKKPTGVAILATEPKQLTIVNIAGSIDLASLSELGGHFNIPKIPEKKE
jgi:hypothetical protein